MNIIIHGLVDLRLIMMIFTEPPGSRHHTRLPLFSMTRLRKYYPIHAATDINFVFIKTVDQFSVKSLMPTVVYICNGNNTNYLCQITENDKLQKRM